MIHQLTSTIKLYEIDAHTLVTDLIWVRNGKIVSSESISLLWATSILAIPFVILIYGKSLGIEQWQQIILLSASFLISSKSFNASIWRIPTTLALLLLAKYCSRDHLHFLEITLMSFGIGAIITTLYGLFKFLSSIVDPWIEFNRKNQSMCVFKSHLNKKLIHEIPFLEINFEIRNRIIQTSKYSSSNFIFLCACFTGHAYEISLLLTHPKNQFPRDEDIQQGIVDAATIKQFMVEWMNWKSIS